MRWRRIIAAVFVGMMFSGPAGAAVADPVAVRLQEVVAPARSGPAGAEIYRLAVDALTLAVCAIPGGRGRCRFNRVGYPGALEA